MITDKHCSFYLVSVIWVQLYLRFELFTITNQLKQASTDSIRRSSAHCIAMRHVCLGNFQAIFRPVLHRVTLSLHFFLELGHYRCSHRAKSILHACQCIHNFQPVDVLAVPQSFIQTSHADSTESVMILQCTATHNTIKHSHMKSLVEQNNIDINTKTK